MRALLARWSMEVWEDRRIMRDSASANCERCQHFVLELEAWNPTSRSTTMFGMDSARNSAYRSVYDELVLDRCALQIYILHCASQEAH